MNKAVSVAGMAGYIIYVYRIYRYTQTLTSCLSGIGTCIIIIMIRKMCFRLAVRSNAYYYYIVTTGVFIVRVSNYITSIISRVENKFHIITHTT
jgi:hypothetical protein